MLDRRPNGDLGPKYTITWTVPGPNNETWKLKQELYPYAESGPVTYLKPGQTVFRIPGGTRGGWFQADSRLKKTLVAAGLPSRPVADESDTTSLSTNLFRALAVALFLGRRRVVARSLRGSGLAFGHVTECKTWPRTERALGSALSLWQVRKGPLARNRGPSDRI
jgi:hypothetical protein